MTVNRVLYQSLVDVSQTISGEDIAEATITRNQFNTRKDLTPTSTPAVSKYVGGTLTFSGSSTMNLASVSGGLFAAENLTGLKVRVFKIKASPNNVNDVTVQDGASNGYGLMGSSFSVTLRPGQEIAFYGDEDTPTVASGARTIDFSASGTGTPDNEIDFSIAAGS